MEIARGELEDPIARLIVEESCHIERISACAPRDWRCAALGHCPKVLENGVHIPAPMVHGGEASLENDELRGQ